MNKNTTLRNIKERFDKIYTSGYDSLAWSNEPIPTEITKYVDQLVSSGYLNIKSNILDLGCGRGRLLISLENSGFVSAVGVDVSGIAIKLAKPKLKISKVLVADVINGLPFPDNTFDLVTELTLVCSLNPMVWPIIYKEIRRVLKKDGYLISEMFIRDQRNNLTNNQNDPLDFKNKTIPNNLDQIYGITAEELKVTFGKYFSILNATIQKQRTLDIYYLLGRNRK